MKHEESDMPTTTHGRTGGGLPADSGGARAALPSTPAPEEPPPAPPAAGPDQRTRTAFHEAGHSVAQVWLQGPEAVAVVSIRPGKGHRGVTLLDSRPTDRRERELAIVAVLCGDLAAGWAVPMSGWGESDAEVAAVAATASLDALAPLTRERPLEAEADEAPVPDELAAERWAMNLADWSSGMESQLHVAYLRAVADGFVRRHVWAIRRVAEALLEHETLDGAEVAAIVHRTRCVCHAAWTTTVGLAAQGLTSPTGKETAMRNKPAPAPEGTTAYGGPNGARIGVPLTLGHERAMVATRDFWVDFVTWPGGYTSPGRTHVTAGQLADARSALVLRAPKGSWRRPTREDRIAVATAATKAASAAAATIAAAAAEAAAKAAAVASAAAVRAEAAEAASQAAAAAAAAEA